MRTLTGLCASLALSALLAATATSTAARPLSGGGGAASPDAVAGKKVAAQCMGCHDLSADRQNQLGPPLWGVAGRPRGSAPGFQYSAAMKADHAPWTPDRLQKFLASPQAYVPGTTMMFPGLHAESARADLIAYLATLTQ